MNARKIGLALLAAMALSAAAAQGTQGHEFTSASNATVVTGTGTNHTWIFNGTVFITCHAFFKGTRTGTAADALTVHPVYSNETKTCETPIGNAQIDTKGCDFALDSDTDAKGDAPLLIICSSGHAIKFTGTACTISVGSQLPGGGGVSFANLAGDVKWTFTMTNIHYTTSGFGCALLGLLPTDSDGIYTGTTTVQGFVDNGTSGTATNGFTYTEGAAAVISVD